MSSVWNHRIDLLVTTPFGLENCVLSDTSGSFGMRVAIGIVQI